ncbi:MAG TPA: ornithine cyclodeaminase family protein [Puia sp.]|jgi:ornithine cyclodeaminase
MDPLYINKEKITVLLPMDECIAAMETMFCSLANGDCLQPLRSIMWLPDKSGLLGMMPGYAKGPGISDHPGIPTHPGVMVLKAISIFPGNHEAGYPSHQGVVILFDGKNGTPLMFFDAAEITAIRTAAASAVATRLLSRKDSKVLAILGSGEQAEKHIEAILQVRNIDQINIWSRDSKKASALAKKLTPQYPVPIHATGNVREAIGNADIICTVTASKQPILTGDWIPKGAHINAVGSSTPAARELDTTAIKISKLFTDRYESLFNEAGDFLIPKSEGAITDQHVKGEIGEVLIGTKKGRESNDEITLFKSLGISAEDLFAAWHIYKKLNP